MGSINDSRRQSTIGQTGNPGGVSKGSRGKLTDVFIRALARDWEAHGEEVIKRVRDENPLAYLKGMLSLLPKDVSSETQTEQTPSEGFPETQALIEGLYEKAKRKTQRLIRTAPKQSHDVQGRAIGQSQ
jgi:hypothetical protein